MASKKDVRRELYLTLRNNKKYLQALHTLTDTKESADKKKKAREELKPLCRNSITASILTECLSIVLDNPTLNQELEYSKEFLETAKNMIKQLGSNELYPENIDKLHSPVN